LGEGFHDPITLIIKTQQFRPAVIWIGGVLHNPRLFQIVGKPLGALPRYAYVAGYLGNREWLLYDRTEDLPTSTRQLEWLGQAVPRGQQPTIESECLQNKFRQGVSSFRMGHGAAIDRHKD
jgi:hypothetical protein